jgi:hypothetical protein
MQSNSRTRELKSNADWVIALDYGAVGLTASSLAMLVIQLVFAGDPPHSPVPRTALDVR